MNKKQFIGILKVVCCVLFFIMIGTCVLTMVEEQKGINDVTSHGVEAAVIFGAMFMIAICGVIIAWNTDTKAWRQEYNNAKARGKN